MAVTNAAVTKGMKDCKKALKYRTASSAKSEVVNKFAAKEMAKAERRQAEWQKGFCQNMPKHTLLTLW